MIVSASCDLAACFKEFEFVDQLDVAKLSIVTNI